MCAHRGQYCIGIGRQVVVGNRDLISKGLLWMTESLGGGVVVHIVAGAQVDIGMAHSDKRMVVVSCKGG